MKKNIKIFLSLCMCFFAISTATANENENEDYSKIELNTAVIHISVDGNFKHASLELISSWTEQSALAVEQYYSEFPIAELSIMFQAEGSGSSIKGTAFGGSVPYIIIRLGEDTTADQIKKDWVLTHEMVHLALPNLDRKHHWLEEGLATYVEPFARRDAGMVSSDYVWQWLKNGLPNATGDSSQIGLDQTPNWAQIYWGSTLFCFLADLAIRERSGGKYSLQDALIGIQQAGGNISQSWEISKLLSVADSAVSDTVLSELYAQMAHQKYDIDLEQIWRELGLSWGPNQTILRNPDALKAKLLAHFEKSSGTP